MIIALMQGGKRMDDYISRQQVFDALRTCYDTETITMDNGDEYINYNDAIGEIEQLSSVQPKLCGDAVSRNAIVQRLNKMDRYVSTKLRLCDTDKEFPQNEVFIVDDVYEEIIEQLPSIQPEYPKGRWIPTASRRGRHECSRCHEYAPCYQDGSEHLSTFCVLCGAKMEEGK